MRLTPGERSALAGVRGDGLRKAMEILVAVGEACGAARMLPVRSVQVSGASYKTLTKWGMEFVESFSAVAKVHPDVVATLNPIGMDRRQWRAQGVPRAFRTAQTRILSAYSRMGVRLTCTCTPYEAGYAPARGQHIAWGESSAVVYANSVIGARTNREGGPSALAAAVAGRTPEYGLHTGAGRRPDHRVVVETTLSGSDFGALGTVIGRRAAKEGRTIPVIAVPTRPSREDLKALGAAMAAAGGVGLFHFIGATPEWRSAARHQAGLPVECVDRAAIDAEEERMRSARGRVKVDLIALGCPHLSVEMVRRVAAILRKGAGKGARRSGAELWLCTSGDVIRRAARDVAFIRSVGGLVLADTCMVVAPLERRFRTTATDSGKAAYYLPTERYGNQKMVYGTTGEVLAYFWE